MYAYNLCEFTPIKILEIATQKHVCLQTLAANATNILQPQLTVVTKKYMCGRGARCLMEENLKVAVAHASDFLL